jgi:hypothetical protein
MAVVPEVSIMQKRSQFEAGLQLAGPGTASLALGFVGLLATWFVFPAMASAQGITPAPGDIAVSEILFNPASPADDNDGEYFEITNISTKILDFSNLYIQDLETPGSATAPYIKIPAGALPLLYPGDSFVFARNGDPALNGGIPKVDYAYSVPTGVTPPADKSKVSHTGMALSNSSIDAVAVTLDAPQNLGGFVIEMVTYDPTKAPLTNNNGIGFERANLVAGWTPDNVAASKGTFGSIPQSGTPGSMNSNDTTLYSTWYKFDAVNPTPLDHGVLLAGGPASVHKGSTELRLSGGTPATLFAFVISTAQEEFKIFGGTALVAFDQAQFWALSEYQFNAEGKASLFVGLPPQLMGHQFYLQWIAFDVATGLFTFSNGLGVDIVN